MADDIVLVAETGRPTGSSASRRLRATGKVPAVLYGRGADPASLTVDWRDLRAALTTDKGLNALLTLKVGNRRTTALVKEMQRHPVRRDVLHIDFLAVDVDKPITTDVPLLIEGEPEKVLREQGVVEQILNVLIITAKPATLALAEEEEGEEGEEGEGEEGAEGETAEGGEGGGQSAERDEGSA